MLKGIFEDEEYPVYFLRDSDNEYADCIIEISDELMNRIEKAEYEYSAVQTILTELHNEAYLKKRALKEKQ